MKNIVLNILTTCIEKGDVVVLLGCACAWCSMIGIDIWYTLHRGGGNFLLPNLVYLHAYMCGPGCQRC